MLASGLAHAIYCFVGLSPGVVVLVISGGFGDFWFAFSDLGFVIIVMLRGFLT